MSSIVLPSGKQVPISTAGTSLLNAYSSFRNSQQTVNRSSNVKYGNFANPSFSITTSKSTQSASVVPSTTTTNSKNVLGPKLISMQQNLSNKYGIVTFTQEGDVSTVPVSTPIKIFTGVGKFTGESMGSFTQKINDIINQVKSVGGIVGNTIFTAPSVASGNSSGSSSGTIQPGSGENAPGNPASGVSNTSQTPSTTAVTNTDKVIDSLEQFKNFVGPIGLIAGLGLLVLVVLKR